MNNRYDMAIVGGGPAGLSAAITARARNKSVLIVSNPPQENPLAASQLVDNYPGMPGVTGLHLLTSMQRHAHNMGTEFLQARAISVLPLQASSISTASLAAGKKEAGKGVSGEAGEVPRKMLSEEPNEKAAAFMQNFSVTTNSDVVEARTVIIASGALSGGKPIQGEAEFLGRGVSYCATCDGMLYRSATVLVAGFSTEAVEEANFLAELGATVHFVARELPPQLNTRIHRHLGRLLAIEGDALGVTAVRIAERQAGGSESEVALAEKRDESLQEGLQEKQIEVHGVFIIRPGVAPTNMLPTLITEHNYIKVDNAMRTNIEGVFAAGDCTGKPLQVAKAVGEGQVAAFSAVEYLQV